SGAYRFDEHDLVEQWGVPLVQVSIRGNNHVETVLSRGSNDGHIVMPLRFLCFRRLALRSHPNLHISGLVGTHLTEYERRRELPVKPLPHGLPLASWPKPCGQFLHCDHGQVQRGMLVLFAELTNKIEQRNLKLLLAAMPVRD